MGCLKLNETVYEGEIIDMLGFSKKKNSHNKKSQNGLANEINKSPKINELSLKIENLDEKVNQLYSVFTEENSSPSQEKNETDNEKNNKLLKYFNTHPFRTSVAASIIATIIINLCNIFFNNFILFPSKINSKLNSIESKLDNPQNSNDDNPQTTIEERITKLEINVATIANVSGINLYANLDYTDDFISKLLEKTEIVDNNYYASAPPCQNSDIIAIDNENDIKYTKEQLVSEKLLIPYTYNGQEVLFYGQYNQNNNWDKDCIINVYENNKLVLISETEYDNGICLSSKQVYPSRTKEKIEVWSITDRDQL